MQLVHETLSGPNPSRPINLLCVFRDEAILLPWFIKYYQDLGISHFIMIDNNSKDEGSKYLTSLDNINLKLFNATGNYKDHHQGKDWSNQCMQEYCRNQYCIVVDTDELLLFDTRRYASLNALIDEMEAKNFNLVGASLLDMYPKSLNDDYCAGDDFHKHSFYFDDWNDTFYKQGPTLYKKFTRLNGGVRPRIFGTDNLINKFPLCKFEFERCDFYVGNHFLQGPKKNPIIDSSFIKLSDHPLVLLHYKFIKPYFNEYIDRQVDNNQHWQESVEYRTYQRIMKEQKSLSLYDDKFSREYKTLADLDAFWRLAASDK